jgi:manganese/zinc/iron transport system permease protein
MNPYSGVGFFEFFWVLAKRIVTFSTPLATDEVQLAVLSCCALACGLIGPFLVLKKMSMFANSLSHTSLLGIAIVFLLFSGWGLGMLLFGSLLSALLTAGLTSGLIRIFRLQEDASIGLVFTSLFAIGVILVSLYARNSHLSTEAVTGNCDALRLEDLKLSGMVAFFNLSIVTLFYRKLLSTAFDEPFSRSMGLSISFWRATLFFTTSLTCVGSFRAVGVLVVLALLTGPFLTARLFCCRLASLLIWTPLIGICACAIGVALSRAILSAGSVALSTSGLVASVVGGLYIGAVIIKKASFTLRARTSND